MHEWLTADEYLSNQSPLHCCLFHASPSPPSDCCRWNVASPRTRTLIRTDCFEVRPVIIWRNRMRTFSECPGNIHRLSSQSLSRYVSNSHTDRWMWFHVSHDIVAKPVFNFSCYCEITRFTAASGGGSAERNAIADAEICAEKHHNTSNDTVVHTYQINVFTVVKATQKIIEN